MPGDLPKHISVRTTLKPEDIGYIKFLQTLLYKEEYGLNISFENHVAEGLNEFYTNYDPDKDKVWICEHNNTIVGSLMLIHKPGNIAQLRYFLLMPEYRRLGIGKKLMRFFIACVHELKYNGAYLLTTEDLTRAGSLYEQFGFKLTEENETELFGRMTVAQRYDLILQKIAF